MTHVELIKEGLNDWALYFRRKLTDRVATMYLEKIHPYSEKTVKHMFSTILEQEERWPSIKFVTGFLQRSGEINHEYEETEDQTFPVGKLWEGFRVLEKHGKDAFYNFCNSVNMPLNDRQRVLAKYEFNFNVNDLAKGLFKSDKEK